MNRLQDEVELEISVRRLREKFHGKISIDKAALLMSRYGNNHRRIAMEIVLMKDRELDDEDRHDLKNDLVVKHVVEKLKAEEENQAGPQAHSSASQAAPKEDRSRKSGNKSKANKQPNEDKDIQELGERLRVLPLTQANVRMFDNAQRDLIPCVLHQFACERCDNDWWRRVAQRKAVSRCRKCKRKYDPVPEGKMWGIGEFHCPNCARTFRGFGRMDLGSPCYGCRSVITPTKILPPRRNVMGDGPRTKNPHSCLAEDCYNRQEPHVPGTECVHPRSRQRNNKPRVINPSDTHISSGSTVNTCLSQGSILDLYDLVRDDLEDVIYEDSEEDEEDDEEEEGRESDSSTGNIR
ncbi:shiftless antiviral inhibitor of ribosomal frameshifting protein homolog [Sardina pilchardus]|uniref:shiftless antiviral inhibitor of ribosomal frameshifting protein homolog n=1 Tax=Sardina pilchardus TaxID=27697 RepID=UPI002E122C7C